MTRRVCLLILIFTCAAAAPLRMCLSLGIGPANSIRNACTVNLDTGAVVSLWPVDFAIGSNSSTSTGISAWDSSNGTLYYHQGAWSSAGVHSVNFKTKQLGPTINFMTSSLAFLGFDQVKRQLIAVGGSPSVIIQYPVDDFMGAWSQAPFPFLVGALAVDSSRRLLYNSYHDYIAGAQFLVSLHLDTSTNSSSKVELAPNCGAIEVVSLFSTSSSSSLLAGVLTSLTPRYTYSLLSINPATGTCTSVVAKLPLVGETPGIWRYVASQSTVYYTDGSQTLRSVNLQTKRSSTVTLSAPLLELQL